MKEGAWPGWLTVVVERQFTPLEAYPAPVYLAGEGFRMALDWKGATEQ